MSAPFTTVFFGVRQSFSEYDLTLLESRQHAIQRAARGAKLDFEWGNYGVPGEKWLGFIGKRLQQIGIEGASELEITATELLDLEALLIPKLSSIGIADAPKLWVQLHPDD